jgi:hypothetical protein
MAMLWWATAKGKVGMDGAGFDRSLDAGRYLVEGSGFQDGQIR